MGAAEERDLFEEIVRLRREGLPAALATIVECRGSTPQKAGAKMIVGAAGRVAGTLGGGCLEAEVIAVAQAALGNGAARTLRFELTEEAGSLVCGGSLLVFIEPLEPRPRLVVLGAGHVGRAVARAARFAGFRVTVVDDREEFAEPSRLPDADEVIACRFEEVFASVRLDAGAFVLVATRGHKQDFAAVRAALRWPARYVGLVGSRRKRELLFAHLVEEGVDPADCGRVITPAGLAIGSVTPEEIAVSIVAQMIQARREHGAAPGGAHPGGGSIDEDAGWDSEAAAPARRSPGSQAVL